MMDMGILCAGLQSNSIYGTILKENIYLYIVQQICIKNTVE